MSGTDRVTDRSSLTNRVAGDRTTRDEAGRWLKPCPFCGGEAKEHAAFASRSGVGVYVECGVCGAQSRTFWGDGAQELSAEAWNRRAGDEKKCISCAYCDIDEGMCYRDPNHTGRGVYTLLDTSCSWWEERR